MAGVLKRTAKLVGGLVVCAMFGVGGWLAAKQFESPTQHEAAASPRAVEPVFEAVTRGDLVETTTAKAVVKRFTISTHQLSMPDETAVVTAIGRRAGKKLRNGQAILWINGRPIIALHGSFPLWRDLREGDSGMDVAEIQAALQEVGFTVPQDGYFGAATAGAIDELYKQVGARAQRETVTVPDSSKPADEAEPAGENSKTVQQVILPAAELIVLDSLPVVVKDLPPVGTVLSAETATISLGQPVFTVAAELPAALLQRIAEWHSVQATDGTQTVQLNRPSASAVGNDSTTAEPSATETLTFTSGKALPADWDDEQAVMLEIQLSAPILQELLVPMRAIGADSSGQARVGLYHPNGATEVITIEELGCLSGVCAVASDKLVEGDLVRVDRW